MILKVNKEGKTGPPKLLKVVEWGALKEGGMGRLLGVEKASGKWLDQR
jgi:hypothetical protein